MGLLPAGSRILTAATHHETHGGESAAYVGIDLSYLNIVVPAKNRGAFGCLGKPFDYEELRQTIQQAVASVANLPGAD